MGIAFPSCFLRDAGGGGWLLTHPALREVARITTFMSFITAAIDPERRRLASESAAPAR